MDIREVMEEKNWDTWLDAFTAMTQFPPHVCEVLSESLRKLEQSDGFDTFCDALHNYEVSGSCGAFIEVCSTAAARAQIHPYTAYALFCIGMAKTLRKFYEKRGIPQQIWLESMCDLRYKVQLCILINHVVGTHIPEWFVGFFELKRFAFGRLQFEPRPFWLDQYTKNGKSVYKGDPVIFVHIPRTFTPLDYSAVCEAYDRAADFFKKELDNIPLAFVCESWLLDPVNKKLLAPDSNICRFANDFDILRVDENQQDRFCDMWRIFNMEYTGNVGDYPENTSLQRAYKAYLSAGGMTAHGHGAFFYEPDRFSAH